MLAIGHGVEKVRKGWLKKAVFLFVEKSATIQFVFLAIATHALN